MHNVKEHTIISNILFKNNIYNAYHLFSQNQNIKPKFKCVWPHLCTEFTDYNFQD